MTTGSSSPFPTLRAFSATPVLEKGLPLTDCQYGYHLTSQPHVDPKNALTQANLQYVAFSVLVETKDECQPEFLLDMKRVGSVEKQSDGRFRASGSIKVEPSVAANELFLSLPPLCSHTLIAASFSMFRFSDDMQCRMGSGLPFEIEQHLEIHEVLSSETAQSLLLDFDNADRLGGCRSA